MPQGLRPVWWERQIYGYERYFFLLFLNAYWCLCFFASESLFCFLAEWRVPHLHAVLHQLSKVRVVDMQQCLSAFSSGFRQGVQCMLAVGILCLALRRMPWRDRTACWEWISGYPDSDAFSLGTPSRASGGTLWKTVKETKRSWGVLQGKTRWTSCVQL